MPSAVLLLSGGLDSATCLAWAHREGFITHALTLDYGQRHVLEVERAKIVARMLGAASHRVLALDLSFLATSALTERAIDVPKGRGIDEMATGVPVTYVPARNTLLLALATAMAESLGASDVILGVNAVDYSGYPDCRPAFVHAFEVLAGLGTRTGIDGARWHIHAPLLALSKAEIVKRAVDWGVPHEWTISCYDPTAAGSACGGCDACLIRARGFRDAGVEDTAARR